MKEKIEELYKEFGGEVKSFEEFEGAVDVGYRIEYEKRINEVDLYFFAFASGDFNPVHFDEDFASKTKFKGRVVHGMLTTSLVSAAVARMPGTVVLLENCFKYTKPVKIGDAVKVVGEVVEKDRNRFKIEVKCLVGGDVVAEGYVRVLIW